MAEPGDDIVIRERGWTSEERVELRRAVLAGTARAEAPIYERILTRLLEGVTFDLAVMRDLVIRSGRRRAHADRARETRAYIATHLVRAAVLHLEPADRVRQLAEDRSDRRRLERTFQAAISRYVSADDLDAVRFIGACRRECMALDQQRHEYRRAFERSAVDLFVLNLELALLDHTRLSAPARYDTIAAVLGALQPISVGAEGVRQRLRLIRRRAAAADPDALFDVTADCLTHPLGDARALRRAFTAEQLASAERGERIRASLRAGVKWRANRQLHERLETEFAAGVELLEEAVRLSIAGERLSSVLAFTCVRARRDGWRYVDRRRLLEEVRRLIASDDPRAAWAMLSTDPEAHDEFARLIVDARLAIPAPLIRPTPTTTIH